MINHLLDMVYLTKSHYINHIKSHFHPFPFLHPFNLHHYIHDLSPIKVQKMVYICHSSSLTTGIASASAHHLGSRPWHCYGCVDRCAAGPHRTFSNGVRTHKCMYICICIYIYVMYACMHACMYVCMYVCLFVCLFVGMWYIYIYDIYDM